MVEKRDSGQKKRRSAGYRGDDMKLNTASLRDLKV